MPALAVWTPEDGLLGALAPLGLAISAGSSLVLDLDPGGPHYPGERSLSDLVAEGPRASDLEPHRGVGVLRNGGVAVADALPLVETLLGAHSRVVLRLPPRPEPSGFPLPVVPVRLLLPGGLYPSAGPAVFQSTPAWVRMPEQGVRLPVPKASTVAALLGGRLPARRDRWVRAWESAWRFPWGR